jgi:hypothetical protein
MSTEASRASVGIVCPANDIAGQVDTVGDILARGREMDYRSDRRHARLMCDIWICEDLCRCKPCTMCAGKMQDPRACPEYYRIFEVLQAAVSDPQVRPETMA